MKQALLIVSFGTSVDTAQNSISAVEEALAYVIPHADIYQAFTSSIIRAKLSRQGRQVRSPEEMLRTLAEAQYETVYVQPTHLLYGAEYDKLKAAAEAYAPQFSRLVLGKPLFSDIEDLRYVARALAAQYSSRDEALVLMGHGTSLYANMVYPAFQTALHMEGCTNAYVGTVESWPAITDVIAQLEAAGEHRVLLIPLMLVAGDHAQNDMAGDAPDSWKCRLETAGFTVRCHLEGLGMLPEVQSLYCAHLKALTV